MDHQLLWQDACYSFYIYLRVVGADLPDGFCAILSEVLVESL